MASSSPLAEPEGAAAGRPTWMAAISELEEILARETACLLQEFPHCLSLPRAMSSPGVAYHLPPAGEFANTGTFMLLLKYSPESGTVTAECSMEMNYQTVRDLDDSVRVAVASADREELVSFVRTKVAQFRDLYRQPQDLGPEEIPKGGEKEARQKTRPTSGKRKRN
jgi:hypothetical protein